jgi:Domain of unknown function (DUF5671)
VSEPNDQTRASLGRGATVISQAYYYVVAAVGLIFLLGGLIAALIALRKWVFPISETGSSSYGGPLDRNDAARSFLGALAFAIPGALVLWWHLREARRREGRRISRESWGGVLYFHLVALITLMIALGGVVATLHAVRDWALPICYEPPRAELSPVEGPLSGSGFEGEGSPIIDPQYPVDLNPGVLKQDCYPPSSEASRSVLDGVIVALVAGGTWLWHLRRGRRALDEPPIEG